MIPFTFPPNRQFQVWLYAVGHRTLLLRSVKTEESPTLIDVLFKGVSALYLPAVENLTELVIHRGNEMAQDLELTPPEGTYLFKLESFGEAEWVLASVVFAHEDQGEFFDRSGLDVFSPPGIGNVSDS